MSRVALSMVVLLSAITSLSAQSFSTGGLLDRLQSGGVLLHFAMMDQPSVQQELRVTPEQVQAVRQLGDQQRAKLTGLSQLPQAEVAQKIRQVQTTAETELRKILSGDQFRRLTEISLQQAGPVVGLNRGEVAEFVQLTSDQQSQLRRLRDDLIAEATEGVQSGRLRQGGLLASVDRLRTAKQQADDQALAVLTAEQKSAWMQLQGAPFHGEISLRPPAAGGVSRPFRRGR